MLTIAAEQLRELVPAQSGRRADRQHEIIEGVAAAGPAALAPYAIDTPLRLAHFLAQIAHESDGLCTTEEYASGAAYEHNVELGNTHAGDGPLFKGRGLIQLTGRANYASVGAKLHLDLVGQPSSVGNPYVYLLVSCVFWQQKGINRFCDADDLIAVTRAVNGGLNGLDSRKAYLAKAKAILAAMLAQGAQPGGGAMAVLHLGSEGDGVATLQKDLTTLGYPLPVDASFGAATEVAVKHFQAAAGLEADGIVGGQTWERLQAAMSAVH